MTHEEYIAALKKLALSPHGKATAAELGLSLRQCQRYASGENIPETVAKLLRLMILQKGKRSRL